MSLAARLTLVLLLPIALCFAAFAVNTVRLRRDLMTDEAAREVRDHAATLQVTLGAFLHEHTLRELAPIARGMANADRIRSVLIFDAQGPRPLVASRPVRPDDAALAPLVRRASVTAGGAGEIRRLPDRALYAYAFPVGPGVDGARGVIVVLRDLAYVEANVRSFVREIALVGLVVMCVVALGTWLAMRTTVIRPISALLRGVEGVAAGDLGVAIVVPRRDELGRLATAFNDMTASLRDARAELEAQSEANVALERRLQHAQRLALIGQLAANVAHQVGSPLNVILGRARYALKQGGQSERDARHFQEIVAGAENISRVIEGLLSQARRARGPVGAVDLGQLARATVRFLETECDRAHVTPSVDAAPDVLVEGRRDELEQVLLNLCVNAVQAQPNGGRLALTVRWSDARDAAELTVADAGPGVPEDLRARVFEPFFTTKPAGRGTGLGLAICDEIVRRHGGTLVVSEAPGGTGALFRVTLPARPAVVPRGAPESAERRSS